MPNKDIVKIGQKYNRLTIISEKQMVDNRTVVECLCDGISLIDNVCVF